MIPSFNGIEISVKGATSVLLGIKGLMIPGQFCVWQLSKLSVRQYVGRKEVRD